MTKSLEWIEAELKNRKQMDLLRDIRTRESPAVAGQVQIAGKPYLNFGSNDYLGLASDNRLVEAVKHFSGQLGWGSGSSPLITGHGVLHRKLETELANFKNEESALLFPTGFAANVGVITSLVGVGDVVFSDALNHASIIDGCRLSGAKICVYRHNDCDDLAEQLGQKSGARRRLVVTDGLFSMDGDFAKLPRLAELADEFDAMLMVDEAHATGVFGEQGRGVCELLEIEKRADIRVGTLSKSFGSFGGFVTGNRSLIQWIYNSARSYIFSTAQPEAISAASLAALEIVQNEPERRHRLHELAFNLRHQLCQLGFDIGKSESQIIPILIGANKEALKIEKQLRDNGIWVPAIRPPSVPQGQARLRISLCSEHRPEHMESLCDNLKKLV